MTFDGLSFVLGIIAGIFIVAVVVYIVTKFFY